MFWSDYLLRATLNITKAFETAKNLDITTIAFTGENGGKLKEVADYILQIPSTDTPRIQEAIYPYRTYNLRTN